VANQLCWDAVAASARRLVAWSNAGDLSLKARLLPREGEILCAGGVLKYLRAGGQPPLGIVERDRASAESGVVESGNRS